MEQGGYYMQITLEENCPENVHINRPGDIYGKIEHKIYHSTTTGLNRGVNILLPVDYSEDKKYPVMYFLHGIFGDEFTMLTDKDIDLREIVGNLIADGKAKEMIVVVPNIYATSDPDQKPEFNSEAILPYNNFINELVNDIMPFIENNYSIATGRDNQAIIGFSMGGRQTLNIGLRRPDLFGYYCAISPAPGLTPGKDWATTHPGQMSEEEAHYQDSNHLPYLAMICCGTEDDVVGKFPESYHNIFTKNKVEHIWYEIPGAKHDAQAIRSGLYNFINAIFHE